jgi:hypothetical protein
VAMPLKEPLPSFGTAAQPEPNWASMGAEEVTLSDGLAVIEGDIDSDAEGLWAAASVELEPPQAERLSGTATARAAIRLLRRVFIMVSLVLGC